MVLIFNNNILTTQETFLGPRCKRPILWPNFWWSAATTNQRQREARTNRWYSSPTSSITICTSLVWRACSLLRRTWQVTARNVRKINHTNWKVQESPFNAKKSFLEESQKYSQEREIEPFRYHLIGSLLLIGSLCFIVGHAVNFIVTTTVIHSSIHSWNHCSWSTSFTRY